MATTFVADVGSNTVSGRLDEATDGINDRDAFRATARRGGPVTGPQGSPDRRGPGTRTKTFRCRQPGRISSRTARAEGARSSTNEVADEKNQNGNEDKEQENGDHTLR